MESYIPLPTPNTASQNLITKLISWKIPRRCHLYTHLQFLANKEEIFSTIALQLTCPLECLDLQRHWYLVTHLGGCLTNFNPKFRALVHVITNENNLTIGTTYSELKVLFPFLFHVISYSSYSYYYYPNYLENEPYVSFNLSLASSMLFLDYSWYRLSWSPLVAIQPSPPLPTPNLLRSSILGV